MFHEPMFQSLAAYPTYPHGVPVTPAAHVQVTQASTVVLAVPSCPLVKLDDKHYKLVDKMEALVEDYPSMKDAKSLTVKGPVKFSKGVVIKGAVTVNNGECNARSLYW